MLKTFKYRIFPTKKQVGLLRNQLYLCKDLYNAILEQKISAYKRQGKSLSKFDQIKELPELKNECEEFSQVYSQTLQNVVDRCHKAFSNFFGRVKRGEVPGFPRFRSGDRYKSITYPQNNGSWKVVDNKFIKVPNIGRIKTFYHRQVEGNPKTLTISIQAGKWFISIASEVPVKDLPTTEREVAIDLGLKTFATLSNKEVIKNPKFLKQELKALAKANRKFSNTKKRTEERKKRRLILNKVYARINNKRDNFLHQTSRKLVNTYDAIYIEDLKVSRMNKTSEEAINRTWNDSSLSKFINFLTYKAEEAGSSRKLIKVNPAYTSKTCSKCFSIKEDLTLKDRTYTCPTCGLHLNRDYNASLNILRLGLQSLELVPRSRRL